MFFDDDYEDIFLYVIMSAAIVSFILALVSLFNSPTPHTKCNAYSQFNLETKFVNDVCYIKDDKVWILDSTYKTNHPNGFPVKAAP